MNRRSFIKHAAAITPLILAFDPIAIGQQRFLQSLLSESIYKNRILVLIELNGGNDGLNTFIPMDKYGILTEARGKILIPENRILKLKDSNIFGFHPSMTGIHSLYNNKLVSVIQGVGYPNPEFSHFRGISIKYTADTEKESRSGWLGRYLEQEYPHYPEGYPADKMNGPPAIRVGFVTPKITYGANEDFSIGVMNLPDLDNLSKATADDPVSRNTGGANIEALRAMSKQVKLYAPTIRTYANKQETRSRLYPDPETNTLADQLKIVAKLIGSEMDTRIYIVNQTGYDTHGEQVDKSDTTQGKHATLLRQLSEAVTAFEDDLQLMGKQDEVLAMTFSEFGRRIIAPNYGTDHGTADTVMLFGSKLKSSIIGTSPDLPLKVKGADNLPVQHDFRSVYKSVLRGWFGISDERIKAVIPTGPDDRMDLFKA